MCEKLQIAILSNEGYPHALIGIHSISLEKQAGLMTYSGSDKNQNYHIMSVTAKEPFDKLRANSATAAIYIFGFNDPDRFVGLHPPRDDYEVCFLVAPRGNLSLGRRLLPPSRRDARKAQNVRTLVST
jgi:hypothetical protein